MIRPEYDNVVELHPRPTNELPATCGSEQHPELFRSMLRRHVDKQTTDANNAYGPMPQSTPRWVVTLVVAAVAFMLYYF